MKLAPATATRFVQTIVTPEQESLCLECRERRISRGDRVMAITTLRSAVDSSACVDCRQYGHGQDVDGTYQLVTKSLR